MDRIGSYTFDEFVRNGTYYYRLGCAEWFYLDSNDLIFVEPDKRQELETWYQLEFPTEEI